MTRGDVRIGGYLDVVVCFLDAAVCGKVSAGLLGAETWILVIVLLFAYCRSGIAILLRSWGNEVAAYVAGAEYNGCSDADGYNRNAGFSRRAYLFRPSCWFRPTGGGLTRSGSGSCEAEFACGGISAAGCLGLHSTDAPQLVQNFESFGISFPQVVQYMKRSFYSSMFTLE